MGDFENLSATGEPRDYEFELNSFLIMRSAIVAAAVDEDEDDIVTRDECGALTLSLNIPDGNSIRQFRMINTGAATLYVSQLKYYSKSTTDATVTSQYTENTLDFNSSISPTRMGIAVPPGGEFVLPAGYVTQVLNPSTESDGTFDWYAAFVDTVITANPDF